ncbi:MAG: zinc ribbon domain-containing protein [Armatimonadetes bacterium]|nr:zinc ribbon domain-containing protein [Armatimonadota bacterium]
MPRFPGLFLSGDSVYNAAMPIYEYCCHGCGHEFELLLRSQKTEATCPRCQSSDLRKRISGFNSSNGSGEPDFQGCGRCGSSTPGQCMLDS